MEKIHENMCKQVCSYVIIQENYIEAHVLIYFSPISAHFTPHYIIMVKSLLYTIAWAWGCVRKVLASFPVLPTPVFISFFSMAAR